MLEVEVKNFQSIQQESIRIDGFTALVGRSNIGKSAIVRAIKAALTGAPVDEFVRHDPGNCDRLLKGNKSCKCFCSVHIKSEGFDLLWQKGDPINQYDFNDQTYTVVGRGTPEFLEDGFSLVKVGDSKQLIQVSDQFHPLFLLDQSGTVVADVLSDVAHLNRINKAMGFVEKDRKEASSTRKVREKDVIDLKLRLSSFEGLDDVVTAVRQVEADEQQLLEATATVARIAEFYDSVLTLARRVKALTGVSEIEIPDNEDLVGVGQGFAQLGTYVEVVGQKEATISVFEGIEKIEFPTIEPLQGASAAFSTLKRWVDYLVLVKVIFAKWKGVEDVPVPDISGLAAVAQNCVLLETALAKQTACGVRIEELERGLEIVTLEEAEIKAEVDALGVCPTCTQPLGGAHTHAVSV